ncbi:MAG: hypothetical protein JNK15_17245 [Planctomycetes bacterium]|nr:hypothetical protein [Planctomycetota bacterium]
MREAALRVGARQRDESARTRNPQKVFAIDTGLLLVQKRPPEAAQKRGSPARSLAQFLLAQE